MFRFLHILSLAIFALSAARGQLAPAAGTSAREWTSSDGKKISAEYLGVQGTDVVLKLPNGKISAVALVKLSKEDNDFIAKNHVDYWTPWRGWPSDAGFPMQNVAVTEIPGEAGAYIYTTAHFKFRSDVNLGTGLMKDLAQVFELTHHLHTQSPFGLLAQPEQGYFNAKLFGTLAKYMESGGKPQTAGLYTLKDKTFMAPLELMGVRASSAGWRKDPGEYDLTTVVHELTHMLTHDMLGNLPTWMNEGYAEYISNIPIENGAFKTTDDKIREGILDMFVRRETKQSSIGSRRVVGMGERLKLQKSGLQLNLPKVEKVLMMTDLEWANGPAGAAPSTGTSGPTFVPMGPGGRTTPLGTGDPNRLPHLYTTSHLILYYFIQIEKEQGVAKLRNFLRENRKTMASYLKYREDFKAYEAKMQDFMKLPGVTDEGDGKFRYPSNLQPPVVPEVPFGDPNALKLGGIQSLLCGESATVVGARIETALMKDLGMHIQFR